MGILDQWNKSDNSKRIIIKRAITNGQTVRFKYRKFNGEFSERTLSKITFNNDFEEEGFHDDHIKGFCHLRGEERTFKIDRIISIIKVN